MKAVLLSAVMAMMAIASCAQAGIITFETAWSGEFAGSGTEHGFTYFLETGSLYVNDLGQPGQDMEGSSAGSGGVLRIAAIDNSLFTFAGLDYAAFWMEDQSPQLQVTGWLKGFAIGMESFLPANTLDPRNFFFPSLDWASYTALNLANLNIDALTIRLDAGIMGGEYFQAIDNVILGGAAVTTIPEPKIWALMIMGLALMAGTNMRRQWQTL